MAAVAGLEDQIAAVRARIASAGGSPEAVTVVAVTKGFGPDAVVASLDAGLADIGENYAQELLAKASALSSETGHDHEPGGSPVVAPRWHFLGTPQRNKMARLAPLVALWQGIDRRSVIDRLAVVDPDAALLVQVNVVDDPAKGGCPIDEVAGLVDHARQLGLEVRGLMCVGPVGDVDGAKRAFARLAQLGDDNKVDELSMGMSDDFEAAVAEGATMVRLGRALFGPRPSGDRVRR
jgi:pyridoxal phosphate enzyme (YggS family)